MCGLLNAFVVLHLVVQRSCVEIESVLNICVTSTCRVCVCVCVCVCAKIDMLVNNAGRSQRAWVIDTPLQIDRDMISLNVVGPVSLTKCVLPHMVARRHGYILVNSSVMGKMRKTLLINSTNYTLTVNIILKFRNCEILWIISSSWLV